MSNFDVRKMKSAAQAATPGPWMNNDYYRCVHTHADGVPLAAVCYYGNTSQPQAEGEHIATSNPAAVLALIDLAERLAKAWDFERPDNVCALVYAEKQLLHDAKAAGLLGEEGDDDE